MYVLLGNDKALEGYRDPTSDDPDLVRYRDLEGQRVTSISIPEGMSLNEAFQSVVTAFEYHIAQGEKPSFVESDSEGLQALLSEHFGLTKTQNTRPKTWGKETGALEVPLPGTAGDEAR